MQQYLMTTQRKQHNKIKKRMKANQTDTIIITITQQKYKYMLKRKQSLCLLIENKLLSDIYNNT